MFSREWPNDPHLEKIANRLHYKSLSLLSVQTMPADGHIMKQHNFTGNCKFENFRENFLFANSVKTYILDVEIRVKGVIYRNK